jgi:hypothetical protein
MNTCGRCDRKRDIVFGGYATVTLGFHGLAGGGSADQSILIVGSLGLIVLGVLLGMLFTAYRAWHGLYVCALGSK